MVSGCRTIIFIAVELIMGLLVKDKPCTTTITAITLEVISHHGTDKQASHIPSTFRNMPARVYQFLEGLDEHRYGVSNRGKLRHHCHEAAEQLILAAVHLYLIV